MEPLPIGVVGVGHLGSLHTKMLSQISAVRLVGVTDIDTARAEIKAQEFSTKAFRSVNELLANVRAIVIATPTTVHFDLARLAIEKNIHVFIEKPITSTVDQARILVEESKKYRTIVQVGHIERFNPAILALEKYLLKPMFIESHRLAQFNPRGTDIAVVLDLMIHDIDIILSLVRSPVEKIEANGLPVVSDTVDIANARLQFANGCVANVTASRISQKKMRKMRLFQKDAYISVDFSEGLAEVFRLVDVDAQSVVPTMMLGEMEFGASKRKIVYEQPPVKEVNALRYELELFADAVRMGTTPLVTAEDGLHALEVAHEIMEKIRQQKLSL
ncbi:MAG TPA: Gfo/Idh/MocA family oxidoreductase [Bacteroidota bacterium]|nr:Gfo/Idh/MocA family oxidoreductase [Bacteroidota bacterium]